MKSQAGKQVAGWLTAARNSEIRSPPHKAGRGGWRSLALPSLTRSDEAPSVVTGIQQPGSPEPRRPVPRLSLATLAESTRGNASLPTPLPPTSPWVDVTKFLVTCCARSHPTSLLGYAQGPTKNPELCVAGVTLQPSAGPEH